MRNHTHQPGKLLSLDLSKCTYTGRVLVVMPLSTTFILFDFIVHNPMHPETKQNLCLLGAAAGYFCRLQYASAGSIPGAPFTEFVEIANQYVQNFETQTFGVTTTGLDYSGDTQTSSTCAPALALDASSISGSVSDAESQ